MDGWQDGRSDGGGAYAQCEDSMDDLDSDEEDLPRDGRRRHWENGVEHPSMSLSICGYGQLYTYPPPVHYRGSYVVLTRLLRLGSNGPHEEHQG